MATSGRDSVSGLRRRFCGLGVAVLSHISLFCACSGETETAQPSEDESDAGPVDAGAGGAGGRGGGGRDGKPPAGPPKFVKDPCTGIDCGPGRCAFGRDTIPICICPNDTGPDFDGKPCVPCRNITDNLTVEIPAVKVSFELRVAGEPVVLDLEKADADIGIRRRGHSRATTLPAKLHQDVLLIPGSYDLRLINSTLAALDAHLLSFSQQIEVSKDGAIVIDLPPIHRIEGKIKEPLSRFLHEETGSIIDLPIRSSVIDLEDQGVRWDQGTFLFHGFPGHYHAIGAIPSERVAEVDVLPLSFVVPEDGPAGPFELNWDGLTLVKTRFTINGKPASCSRCVATLKNRFGEWPLRQNPSNGDIEGLAPLGPGAVVVSGLRSNEVGEWNVPTTWQYEARPQETPDTLDVKLHRISGKSHFAGVPSDAGVRVFWFTSADPNGSGFPGWGAGGDTFVKWVPADGKEVNVLAGYMRDRKYVVSLISQSTFNGPTDNFDVSVNLQPINVTAKVPSGFEPPVVEVKGGKHRQLFAIDALLSPIHIAPGNWTAFSRGGSYMYTTSHVVDPTTTTLTPEIPLVKLSGRVSLVHNGHRSALQYSQLERDFPLENASLLRPSADGSFEQATVVAGKAWRVTAEGFGDLGCVNIAEDAPD